jgi:hypothetical protein
VISKIPAALAAVLMSTIVQLLVHDGYLVLFASGRR